MNWLRRKDWSPYLAGALAGLVMVASVWISGHYFGASTSYVRTAGYIERAFDPDRVMSNDYFAKTKIKVDWQMMFLVGIIFGSLFSSRLSGDFKVVMVPPMWQGRFGSSGIKRAFVAFFGGVLAMFGARLADGCPSGHGLGGLAQMSVSGYVSLLCFFAAGVLAARLLYEKGGR